MRIEVHQDLKRIDASAWNRLNPSGNPFMRYEFLAALENNHCLGARQGWYPRYFAMLDEDDTLQAAVPAYIKTHSHGEFVFDWAWAEAYQKHGLRYYPKLVVSAPYTPVSGNRLLISSRLDYQQTAAALQTALIDFCAKQHLSGLHLLFTTARETDLLEGLFVPQAAVQADQQGAFVLLVDPESKVVRRNVELDFRLETKVLVLEGGGQTGWHGDCHLSGFYQNRSRWAFYIHTNTVTLC